MFADSEFSGKKGFERVTASWLAVEERNHLGRAADLQDVSTFAAVAAGQLPGGPRMNPAGSEPVQSFRL